MTQIGIEFHFALAKPPRSGFRRTHSLVSFLGSGLVLWKGDEKDVELPWNKVEKISYRHFKRSLSGMVQVFSGSLFGRREAVFQVQTEEGMYEFFLELDAEYRSAELKALFSALYLGGIPLFESLDDGLSAFLLQPSRPTERVGKIEGLKAKKGSDE